MLDMDIIDVSFLRWLKIVRFLLRLLSSLRDEAGAGVSFTRRLSE